MFNQGPKLSWTAFIVRREELLSGPGPMPARNIQLVGERHNFMFKHIVDLNSGWAIDEKKKNWNYRLDLSSAMIEV